MEKSIKKIFEYFILFFIFNIFRGWESFLILSSETTPTPPPTFIKNLHFFYFIFWFFLYYQNLLFYRFACSLFQKLIYFQNYFVNWKLWKDILHKKIIYKLNYLDDT